MNRTLRYACQIAFFQRTTPSFLDNPIAVRESRIGYEERFARNIDRVQEKIREDEQMIATYLAEKVARRRAKRAARGEEQGADNYTLEDHSLQADRTRAANDRIDQALSEFLRVYRLVRMCDKPRRRESLLRVDSSGEQ